MDFKVASKADYTGITLAEVKNFLRIDEDNTADDTTLNRMIEAAIELIEKKCRVSLTEATIKVYYEDYLIDEGEIAIPVYPFSEVVSVKTIDKIGAETEQTCLVKGLEMPEIKVNGYIEGDSILLEYKAGYGITDKTVDVPLGIKEAVINQVADWYENRTDWTPVLSTKIKRMLKDYTFSSWI